MSGVDDDPQQTAGVVPGQVLVDKYRVDRVLGVGGMGVVVAARHLQLDTMVAIKILLPGMLANTEAMARFGREARAAIQINNEHVARIFDVGTLSTGAPYMVMELLDGIDLRMLLEQRGPVVVEDAVDFILQACEAVAEAHGLGIVHRDLKPANLFCVWRSDGRPVIKVLDFGISKVTGPMWSLAEEPLTVAAAVMGTPSYMSPEQLETPHAVDTRTDIWSLGVILYELLTGQAPFDGSTLPQVSVRVAVRPQMPAQLLRPNIPLGLVTVIDTCLEKDKEKRYRSVADLAAALQAFGSRRARISVERIIENAELAALPAVPSPSPFAPAAPERGASTARKVVSRLIVLGVALALTGLVIRQSARNEHASPASGLRTESSRPSATTAEKIDIQPLPPPPPGMKGASVASAIRPTPVSAVDDAAPAHVAAGAVRTNERANERTSERASEHGDRGERGGRGDHAPATRRRSRTVSSMRSSLELASSRTTPDGKTPAASRCDPPFDLDDQGRKHFKTECVAVLPAAPSARNEVNCDPSYDLDVQGRKHFKSECFLNAKQ